MHISNRPFLYRVIIVLAILASAGIGQALQTKVVRPLPEYARVAQYFARRFPRTHLDRHDIDDLIAVRAFQSYVNSLDYDHVYFLADDIDRFRRQASNLDELLNEGNVDFAYTVFDVFKQRVNDRHEFVKNILASDFDFERAESYVWKRKDEPWASSEEAWNDLWRRKIKNEYLQRHVRIELGEEEASAEEEAEEDSAEDSAQEAEDSDAEDGETGEPVAEKSPAPLPPPREQILKQYKQFATVLNDYEEEWVLQRYLSAFAHAYDPHSDYMSPSAVSDFTIEMKLSLVGIGALLRAVDGAAEIVRLIPGGPAERAGELEAGDRIIAVGQGDEEPVDTLHWPLSKTVQLIRGEKGTRVALIIIPESDPSGTTTKRIVISRDVVKLEEQAAKAEIHELQREDGEKAKLGVIHLPAFYVDLKAKTDRRDAEDYRSSVRDVRKLIGDMVKQGAEGLVLDLRNNGGGSLLEAVEMTGLFIEGGPVVQVKEQWRTTPLNDPDPSIIYKGPLLVLVSRLSASASEILAGALQDYGRAVIVGDTTTHGKGTVQTVMELDRRDQSLGSIKVTTASFYRIKGGSTQLKGIAADIVVPSNYDRMDIGESSLENPLKWNMVNPVMFRPFSNLRPLIAMLREKSTERREQSAPFNKRRRILDELAELRKMEKVSLTYDDAIDVARTERRLQKLQKESSAAGKEDGAMTGDLVLNESLEILDDLIAELNRHASVQAE
ncbi:MAG: carboxy terminal-processing peptidase [Verrucomicrobia bacterium]|nr:carboxy terminal-processing peptidase [Verrucomicrobiota bacterium]